MAVDLEPVAQAGLDDADVPVHLVDQTVDVGDQLGGEVGAMAGDDGPQQQPAEPWRRLDREHEVAERQPPGRRQRAGVPHLQLGQQHQSTLRARAAGEARAGVVRRSAGVAEVVGGGAPERLEHGGA